MPLDFVTVALVEACLLFALGFLLLLTWSANRRAQGLLWWGAAYLVYGLSVGLFQVGAAGGLAWMISVGWAINLLAAGLMWSAARRFEGLRARSALAGAGMMLMILSNMFRIPPEANVAFAAAGLITAGYLLAAAYVLWRGRSEPLLSRWPAIVLLALSAAVVLARIPLIATAPIGMDGLSLMSPWLPTSLLASLICEVSIAFLVIAMAKERLELHQKMIARIDPLTGLGNRRAFIGLARRRLHRERCDGLASAVLMFDLDHFKRVNDRFGHAFGDEVLRIFANAVHKGLRPTDIVGRIGGEEFAALLSGAGEAEARAAAERVRTSFAAAAKNVDGKDVDATVSIGIAIAEIGMSDVMQLLGRADEALYLAKAHGRNRVEVAHASRPRLAA